MYAAAIARRMAGPGSRALRRRLSLSVVVPAWLLLAGTSCQDDRSLPAGQGPAVSPKALASRFLPFDTCFNPPSHGVLIRDMVRAINAERARNRLEPLRLDETLSHLAEFYACRLADGDFFAHVDPFDGSTVDTRAVDFGYAFHKIGENLAAGQRTVEQAVADWMASADHRRNILDPAYTEIGVAVKEGGSLGPYWVVEFGRPVSAGADPAIGVGFPPQSSTRPTAPPPAASSPADESR